VIKKGETRGLLPRSRGGCDCDGNKTRRLGGNTTNTLLTRRARVLSCVHVVLTSHSRTRREERMASAQRLPRDIPFEADAEYQRLAEQHRQYEAELQKISRSPYLNSEDLLEEIKLK